MQRSLLLLGLCLVVYYLMVYRPLERRAAAMDRPLLDLWRELSSSGAPTGGLGADYFTRCADALRQVQQSTGALERLRHDALARIEPEPITLARMSQPFRNIEFQNERQTRLEGLIRLAREHQVGLGPAVAAGFPEFTAGRRHPSLLWPQLDLVHHLIAAAVHSQVSTVSVVRLPQVQLYAMGVGGTNALAEIPVEVVLSASTPALVQFLESLPLRGVELQERGLPGAVAGKPVLFVRRVMLRKENRQSPDQVRLELTAVGFVTFTAPPSDAGGS